MSATNDRRFADVADELAAWRRLDSEWDCAKRQRAAPFLEAFDDHRRGLLDREELEREIGDLIQEQFLLTFAQAWRAGHRCGDRRPATD